MKKSIGNEMGKVTIVNIILFLFLFVFFTRICPIVLYDKDDWIYIGQMRIPFPQWNGWNPVKVLPEILMPICGYISAYFIYPIIGNYFFSITITSAIILSIFIVILCLCVMQLIRKRFNSSVELALIFEVLFLVGNFLIYRNRGTSRYMFYADNMNCIFNYTIPGIINAIAVLVMMQYQNFQKAYKTFSTLKKGLFITLIYFAIFSNIFHSAILAIYCGVMLLNSLISGIRREKWHIKNYMQENGMYLLIVFTWMISILFELNGGRAASLADDGGLSLEVSIRQLWALIQALANPFVIVVVISGGWGACRIIQNIFNSLYRRKQLDETVDMYMQLLVCMALLLIYLIILCSGVNYMSRIEASWNLWFCLILITCLSMADFISLYPKTKPLLVPIVLLGTILSFYPDGRFLMSTVDNLDYATCVNTGEYVVNQIIDADRAGLEIVVVHIPMYTEEKKKWVFDSGYPQAVMNTLYNHGIIHNKLEVQANADSKLLEILKGEKK